ncbi:MAG: SpoIIE family protein phosphatase [Thermoleophilaceae bacterium]
MSTRRPQRSDARRHREALLAAAAAELAAGRRLEIQRIASSAGVSRSTVHRHFRNAAGVERALAEEAVAEAQQNVERGLAQSGAPLADLREVVAGLADVGARFALGAVDVRLIADHSTALAPDLAPLASRVLDAADISSRSGTWLNSALTELTVRALRSASSEIPEPREAAEALFRSLTERLDRGLVLVDAGGKLLAGNELGGEAFGLPPDAAVGEFVGEPQELRYEDDTRCPPGSHPLTVAVATRESQPAAIRGHRADAEPTRWFVVEVSARRVVPEDEPYAFLAILTDVSEERREQLTKLRPAGTLGRDEPLILDAARALDDVPAHLLPDQLVAEARRLVKVPVALYVVDIDGSHLLRLAGAEDLPERIDAPLALGPELAHDGIPDLRARLVAEMPGVALAPMWLRGRAVGILLAAGGDERFLTELARQGAAAIELGNGYTDVFDATRRRKDINPAAEIQQSLLPPRIVRMGSGRIGSSILPAYEVGGDWFDYVENRDGAWFAIADASGKGVRAGALGSIGLAALRAARRNDADVVAAMQTIHETIWDASEEDFYLTAIVARWNAAYRSFSWINAGHPPPLLFRSDGGAEEMAVEPDLPLGVLDRERKFRLNHRRVAPGERIVLYTDGISNRPTRDGLFGRNGIIAAVGRARDSSPTATARSIQIAVVEATTDLLRDDAAVVVFAPDAARV